MTATKTLIDELLQHNTMIMEDEMYRGFFKKAFKNIGQSAKSSADAIKKEGEKYMDKKQRKKMIAEAHQQLDKEVSGNKDQIEKFVKYTKVFNTLRKKHLFPNEMETTKFKTLKSTLSDLTSLLVTAEKNLDTFKMYSNPSCINKEILGNLKMTYGSISELEKMLKESFKEKKAVVENLSDLGKLFGDENFVGDYTVVNQTHEFFKTAKLDKTKVINPVMEALKDTDGKTEIELLKYVKEKFLIPKNIELTKSAVTTYLSKLSMFHYLVMKYPDMMNDCENEQKLTLAEQKLKLAKQKLEAFYAEPEVIMENARKDYLACIDNDDVSNKQCKSILEQKIKENNQLKSQGDTSSPPPSPGSGLTRTTRPK